MKVKDAREILLQMFPRKVSMEEEDCRDAIDEISALWKFVDRVHAVENAKKIGAEIRALHAEFHQEMSDPQNFGQAKSFFMEGKAKGFDMTTQEGAESFMQFHNAQIATNSFDSTSTHSTESPVAGMSRKQRKKLLAKKKNRK